MPPKHNWRILALEARFLLCVDIHACDAYARLQATRCLTCHWWVGGVWRGGGGGELYPIWRLFGLSGEASAESDAPPTPHPSQRPPLTTCHSQHAAGRVPQATMAGGLASKARRGPPPPPSARAPWARVASACPGLAVPLSLSRSGHPPVPVLPICPR